MGRHRATKDRPSWLAVLDVAAGEWGGARHVDTDRQPGRSADGTPDDDLIPGMRHPDDPDGWDR